MAPGPAPSTQFGMAADERARGQQAALGEQVGKERLKAIEVGGKAATEQTKNWGDWQSGFHAQVDKQTKTPASIDPNAAPPMDDAQKQFVIETGDLLGQQDHANGTVQPYGATASRLIQYAQEHVPSMAAATAQATTDLKGKGSPEEVQKRAREIIAQKTKAARATLGLPVA
jgi:hypothetical protein